MFKLIAGALLCFLGPIEAVLDGKEYQLSPLFSLLVNHLSGIEQQKLMSNFREDLVDLEISHFGLLRQNLFKEFV